jgi:hypothetical protein
VDINNLRQNHPELIVRDLAPFVDGDVVRQVLKYRGVNKWLTVRRLLIQLKERWREEIAACEAEKKLLRLTGDREHYWEMKGYVKALTDCRQQVRALCHSPRDVDFPINTDWGEAQALPTTFPKHPHKRWFLKRRSTAEVADGHE